MNPIYTIKTAIPKIEHYCAYQERCPKEVVQKLRSMKMDSTTAKRKFLHNFFRNNISIF